MSLIWVLYLISVANNLSVALGIAWIGSACALALGSFAYVVSCDDEDLRKGVIKVLRVASILFAVALPLDVLIPGKNTMYAMAAVSVGERLADNPAVQGIASDGLKAVQSWISKQLSEQKDK